MTEPGGSARWPAPSHGRIMALESMPHRVLIAGLFHETHTFVGGTTPLADFAMRRGAGLLLAEGDGSPLGGALLEARRRGWEVVPAIDLRAMPSATVEDHVVEVFWESIEDTVRACGDRVLDAVFLVLHGAMVTESFADVEGEVLRRVRAHPRLSAKLVGGVLDLHGNVTQAMGGAGVALLAYRENPHTDAAETATRAVELLDRMLSREERPTTIVAQPPVVWPSTATATADRPMRDLESMARTLERECAELLAVNVFAGYSLADVPATGVGFSAVKLGDPEEARAALDELCRWAVENRALGRRIEPPIDDVMPDVLRHERGPVLLVESSDNIGAGAPGDATGVLRALVRHDVEGGVVVLNDPEAVAALADLHVGDRRRLPLGGMGSPLGGGPFELEVELESRSDGRFELEDRQSHLASMMGVHIDMGPCAVVRHRGVRILLTKKKTPPFDLGQLRSQGIVPETARVIVVKAAVAHRRAYEPIAVASYTVETPGTCPTRLETLPYRRIRRPVWPLDEL